MYAAVSPSVQINADLSNTARDLFFISRAVDLTNSPSFVPKLVTVNIICLHHILD